MALCHNTTKTPVTIESTGILPLVTFVRDIGGFEIPNQSCLLVICEVSDIVGKNFFTDIFRVPLWVFRNGNTFRFFNYKGRLQGIVREMENNYEIWGKPLMFSREPGIKPLPNFVSPFGYDYAKVNAVYTGNYKYIPCYVWQRK